MKKLERRAHIYLVLQQADGPVTGARLAQDFSVSRQIIVKDIAALRQQGAGIVSTSDGYLLLPAQAECLFVCRHFGEEKMEQELYLIVEEGGTVVDVIVEHAIYGEIRNELMIRTHRDVRNFIRRMQEGGAQPLATLTDGLHMHTVRAPDVQHLQAIAAALREAGILVE